MAVTINVNNLSLCHKGSSGLTTATLPDVCKTPSPGGPVPVPYPNIASSRDLMKGTTTIKADGGNMCAKYGSEFFKSTGDEAGTLGGVVSSTFIKEASWITFSFDVKYEGKGACRLTDKMFHNHQNTVNMSGELQVPLAVKPLPEGPCKCDPNPKKIKPTCNAPISKSPNAGCDYYRKRQEDFESRHTCPSCSSHPAPDYYLEYGLKYCEKFSAETHGKLSPAGKKFNAKARCKLQEKMEEGLHRNPELELDSDLFREFAFDTHPSAYLEAGLKDLGIPDQWKIGTTVEGSEFLKLETWKQIGDVFPEVAGQKVKDVAGTVKDAGAVIKDKIGEIFNGN